MSSALPSGPLILVVDDHEDTLELYAIALRRAGYQVVTAGDGTTAVREAAEKRPAAVVMDVVMPLMDGREAARRIRSALGPVPVVALTAMPVLAGEEQTVFSVVLGKPCTTSAIAAALRDLLHDRPSA